MRTGDAEVIPEEVDKQLPRLNLSPPSFAVDSNGDAMTGHVFPTFKTTWHPRRGRATKEASHDGRERARQFDRQLNFIKLPVFHAGVAGLKLPVFFLPCADG
jgi:hypothetical protein